MYLFLFALLSAIILPLIWIVAMLLYWLFGIELIQTVYGVLTIILILLPKIFWEVGIKFPRRLQIILEILATDGGELSDEMILERSQGELSSKLITPDLSFLVDKGLVTLRLERQPELDLPIFYYKITFKGRRARSTKLVKLRLQRV